MLGLDYQLYMDILQTLTKRYQVRTVFENENVHEVFEGPIPLFKLLFAVDEEKVQSYLVMAFYLDMDPVDAVQWFLRVKELYSKVKISSSYYKDSRGESFTGQSAEIVRQTMVEKAVLGNWTQSRKEAEEFATSPTHGRGERSFRSFIDEEKAKDELLKMQNKDDADEWN